MPNSINGQQTSVIVVRDKEKKEKFMIILFKNKDKYLMGRR